MNLRCHVGTECKIERSTSAIPYRHNPLGFAYSGGSVRSRIEYNFDLGQLSRCESLFDVHRGPVPRHAKRPFLSCRLDYQCGFRAHAGSGYVGIFSETALRP